jgi:hypothetical protein
MEHRDEEILIRNVHILRNRITHKLQFYISENMLIKINSNKK